MSRKWLINDSSWRLFGAFLLTGLSIVSITTLILYYTFIETEIHALRALAQNHAKLINTVAQFDLKFNEEFPEGGSRGATLLQISNTHFEKIIFGKTGEIVIGENNEGRVHFLTPSRILGGEIPSIDLYAKRAEPMQRALFGVSGVMVSQDYQGEQVLAWHEPLHLLNAGLVAKINIDEIRAPFINVVLYGYLISIAVSILCYFIFNLISSWNFSRLGTATLKEGMSDHRWVSLTSFILCLTLIGASSVTSIIWLVYSTQFEVQKNNVTSLNFGMASLIDAVTDFDRMIEESGGDYDATEGTMSQILQFGKRRLGFGETGEIVFGRLIDNEIEFSFPSRFSDITPPSVSFDGINAEPMRRALNGETGFIMGIDYRGVKVVAAYHPLDLQDAGIVTKMDLKEMRHPYLMAGVINISLTIFIIVLGAMLSSQFIRETDGLTGRRPKFRSEVMSKNEISSALQLFINCLLVGMAGLILLLDYNLPLGLAAGVPYISVIIIGAYWLDRRGILALTFLCSILVLIGLFISPIEQDAYWKVLTNRFYALFSIWLVATILLWHKKTEKTIRQNESQLSIALDAGKLMTIERNLQTGILDLGTFYEDMLGYDRGELGNTNEVWESVVYPEDLITIRSLIEDCLAGKTENIEFEYRAITKDKRIKWCETFGRIAERDESGEPLIFMGYQRDISERKQAEEEMLKLNRAVEQSPASVVITNLDGNIEYVNPVFTKTTGYTIEEVLGKNPRVLQSGDTDVKVYKDLWETIINGKEWTGEFKNKKKNGETYWESASISPIRNPDGKTTHYLAVKENITERKQAEDELRQSERQLALTMQAGQFTPWIMDVATDKTQTFSFYEQILAYAPEEMEDTLETWMSVVFPDDIESIGKVFRQFLDGKTPDFRFQYRAYNKDRHVLWIEAMGTITEKDEAGKPAMIMGTQQDITTQKEAELTIKEKMVELEKFNQLAVGRELRMIELKQEVNELLSNMGKEKGYEIVE